MYINELGTRTVGSAVPYGNSSRRTTTVSSFANELQKVLGSRNTVEKADGDSTQSADSESSCCRQCELNSKLLSQMMMQNVLMQSRMGSLGLTGFSSFGTGALSASTYGSMMNLLGGNIFGLI